MSYFFVSLTKLLCKNWKVIYCLDHYFEHYYVIYCLLWQSLIQDINFQKYQMIRCDPPLRYMWLFFKIVFVLFLFIRVSVSNRRPYCIRTFFYFIKTLFHDRFVTWKKAGPNQTGVYLEWTGSVEVQITVHNDKHRTWQSIENIILAVYIYINKV